MSTTVDINRSGRDAAIARAYAKATSAERLAAQFSKKVRERLAPHLDEIRERNRRPDYSGCCATHDFCDANMLMHDALLELLGLDELDASLVVQSSELTTLWNRAWDVARRSGFRLEYSAEGRPLPDGARGPVYGYEIDGALIFDLATSACGRFAASPMRDYGLTVEEIDALDNANMALLGFVPEV